MSVLIHTGDCRDVLAGMEADSIDSCITDPPYHLTSIVKRFGSKDAKPVRAGIYNRSTKGFMGQQWDGGDVAFQPDTWAAVFWVLKPGAHLCAFGGTRTFHRLVCAIEDAGFEVRDTLCWHFGSGFPKSHDVSKAIDRIAPRLHKFDAFAAHYAERRRATKLSHNEICAAGGFHGEHNHGGASSNWEKGYGVPTLAQWSVLQPLLGLSDEWRGLIEREEADRLKVGERDATKLAVAPGQYNDRSATVLDITEPATDAARKWQGWGTALKPATELICLARKPLIGSVAANVLAHGTGAINVDGCRIDGEPTGERRNNVSLGSASGGIYGKAGAFVSEGSPLGRWPANLIHDGSEEVLAGFPETESNGGGTSSTGFWRNADDVRPIAAGDSGSAARFFYCAKSDAAERHLGGTNAHPTVKPIDLMRWLVRLVTPKGGTVLDPFAGSGSTLIAADREQFNAIGIELSEEYAAIARRRLSADRGPLFAEVA